MFPFSTPMLQRSATIATSTFDPAFKSANITLSGGNLIATTAADTNNLVRGTKSRNSTNSPGKYFFEITINTLINLGDFISSVGVVDTNSATSTSVGNTTSAAGIRNNSTYLRNGLGASTGVSFTTGDIIQVCVDNVNNTIIFGKNGTYSSILSGNPTAGTGGLTGFTTTSIFPAVSLGDNTDRFTINTGGSAFSVTMPTGYVAWG